MSLQTVPGEWVAAGDFVQLRPCSSRVQCGMG
eukprot:CAMPEP_0117695004 /NCGR_PEP_ID=MMETSP0804-20121206/27849_1 /TAXON_ID=1074897 /ORGANISM="Tetraselmis astigmatica, Strain CCMP880" /LENGTH=31 /DNA_ID= /DNA_START= /DNA_END= /DNA_ORIENTATION=